MSKGICTPHRRDAGAFWGTCRRGLGRSQDIGGGVPPGRTVIIEFPDLDRAQNWYTSDAYAPLLAHRKTLATTHVDVEDLCHDEFSEVPGKCRPADEGRDLGVDQVPALNQLREAR
jgi:hypothetical protein